MIQYEIIEPKTEQKENIELKEEIFNVKVNPYLISYDVRVIMNNRRQGTANTKTRSEVNKSGRKPYRQKGTGRARLGTLRSPLLKGGGVVFGPKPRDYSIKINKKMKKQAIRGALTLKLKENNLLIMKPLNLEKISTKEASKMLRKYTDGESALIVLTKDLQKEELSLRNLPEVTIIYPDNLNTYEILKYKKLVIFEPALKKIEEVFN